VLATQPVLAAARWKPRIAYCLYSSESKRYRNFIEEEVRSLNLDIDCQGVEINNIEIDPNELYTAVKRAIEPYIHIGQEKNPQIAVDITGGTKVMSVASAMAVSLVGGRFFYILSATARDDIQQRVVGTEFPKLLDDPYAVFGDIEGKVAKRLFNKHNYNGAQRNFNKLAEKVPNNKSYKLYADLSEAYDAWEILNFEISVEKLNKVVENIDYDPFIQGYAHHLREQLTSVRLLFEITSSVAKKDSETQLSVLSDYTKVLYLLSTLRAIAERRASDGRYDVAALYQYRSIELISQHRLARYGLLTKLPNFKPLIEVQQDIESKYLAVRHTLAVKDGRDTLTDNQSISLFEGYIFLEALNDDLVQGFKIKRIMDKSSIRNNSILAHGYSLIEPKKYENFAQVATELYKRLLTIYNEDEALWRTRSEFIQPFKDV
jgi:CRISPR-associated protein (TIGR02710 family)